MKLTKKIALLSLISSLIAGSFTLDIQAKKGSSKKVGNNEVTLKDLRDKHPLSDSMTVSFKKDEIPFTIGEARAKVQKARYGNDNDAFQKALNIKEKQNAKSNPLTDYLAKTDTAKKFDAKQIKKDTDRIDALNKQKQAVMATIDSEPLKTKQDMVVADKDYTVKDLNKKLQSAKKEIAYPKKDDNYADIEKFIAKKSSDKNQMISLADADKFVKHLRSQIKDIKDKYKNKD